LKKGAEAASPGGRKGSGLSERAEVGGRTWLDRVTILAGRLAMACPILTHLNKPASLMIRSPVNRLAPVRPLTEAEPHGASGVDRQEVRLASRRATWHG
jgi:hypothetical protein